ncbi:hypothetical protein, partial [Streptomyces werraensis]|uniref:hypothetical protein n=1 Tax=Streptomyces werraensis TaxID=68284 RepID=UPI0033BEC35F
IGLRPGDVHLNISSPGWAKHAWSNLFAPWNAMRSGADRFLIRREFRDTARSASRQQVRGQGIQQCDRSPARA